MKKTYIEAQYRIKNQVYNHGYICIDGDFINGIFTLDCSRIQIRNGHIHFYLKEYDPEYNSFYETEEFVGGRHIDTLESPCTYILKSNSNTTLTLSLIKRVTDIASIPSIAQTFEELFGK